jgi:transcriptional antiterminator NusG
VDKKWYTVRVMSGQENKVKQTIESELEIAGLGKFVEEIVVPSERIIEMKDGKKKEKNRIFFPGYLLIEMEMEEAARFAIVNTTGVINFVGSQNRPSPLQKNEVERILGRIKASEDGAEIAVPFIEDSSVTIVDGPFKDFTGVVQEVNKEKRKVKVMVSIFGRQTPVELDFLQVQPIK